MSEEFENNKSIDAELQVRLMNLIMGEASDFERDQLQILMEQRTELAAFYEHLEHMHGLLCEVGAGEPPFDAELPNGVDLWQLSSDRRDQLLAVLDGKSKDPRANVDLASLPQTTLKPIWSRRWIAALAVTAASLLLGLLIYPRMKSNRDFAFTRKANELSGGSRSLWSMTNEGLYFGKATASAATRADAPPPTDRVGSLHSDFVSPSASPLTLNQSPPSTPTSPSTVSGPADADGNMTFAGRTQASAGSGRSSTSSGLKFQDLSNATSQTGAAPSQLRFSNEVSPSHRVDVAQSEMSKSRNSTQFAIPSPLGGTMSYSTEQPSTVTAVNGRTVPMGGIAKATPSQEWNRHYGYDNGLDSTLMRTVTPRIILAEEEEKKVTGAVEPELGLAASDKPFLPPSLSIEERRDDPAVRRREYFGDVLEQIDGEQGNVIVRGSIADVERSLKAVEQVKKQNRADLDELRDGMIDSEAKVSSLWAGKPLDALQQSNNEPLDESRFAKTQQSDKLLEDYTNSSKEVASELALRETLSADYTAGLDQQTSSITSDSGASEGRDEYFRREYQPAPSPEIATKGYIETTPEAVGLQRSTPGLPSGPASGPAKPAKPPLAIDEESAAKDAFSTFSLHVSDVSFKLAQTALSQGQWPEADKIRIEEFVNALDYRDPLPSGTEKIACRVEQAIHPFLMQRNLLRVSMRTAATGRSQSTPLRLTILLDNSGSMERHDRRQAVLRAFQTLVAQLKATDQITLISFASTPRLLADKVQGNQSETLLQIIENLPSEGGTNIEAALMLAREKAAEQQLAGAQNRIVLLTDGAVNLGNANPDSLAKLVTQLRDSGIAFDAAGISAHDLNDEVLEALTRQGDGRYYLLDSAQSADESFAAQIAGALRPSAQNVKVQVEFNPQRVGRYKLLGFEKHRLNAEDFRNDKVDAAELAAAEAGVAVYQYEIKSNGNGDVGSVSVRFRDVSSGKMIEHRWPIPYESNTPRLGQADASMQLAACAGLFAAKLGGGPIADTVDLVTLQKLLSSLPDHVARQPRVQQLRAMVEQAIAIGR